jgi:hypothetical protein
LLKTKDKVIISVLSKRKMAMDVLKTWVFWKVTSWGIGLKTKKSSCQNCTGQRYGRTKKTDVMLDFNYFESKNNDNKKYNNLTNYTMRSLRK